MKNWNSFRLSMLDGLVCSIISISINIIVFNYVWQFIPENNRRLAMIFLAIRFFLFFIISTGLVSLNRYYLHGSRYISRTVPSLLYMLVCFAIYWVLTHLIYEMFDWRPLVLVFQFFIITLVGVFLGYTGFLNDSKSQKDQELEKLKIETLQSRCDALTNQINPHFFFNSLNGISSLVRKKDDKVTLEYIDHLSDIFRYILQSENKGLVTLDEEIEFARSFFQVLKVRYAGKLEAEFDIPTEMYESKLPVMSLLPLIENVTVHNMIDSEHLMNVKISINEAGNLLVSNPIYNKRCKQETHGMGLDNLDKRFMLLLNKNITIENTSETFTVKLPLGK